MSVPSPEVIIAVHIFIICHNAMSVNSCFHRDTLVATPQTLSVTVGIICPEEAVQRLFSDSALVKGIQEPLTAS